MTDPVTPVPVERPTPLTALAYWLAPSTALLSAVVGFLVPFGLVNQAQAEITQQVLGAFTDGAYLDGQIGAGTSLTVWTAVASGLISAAAAIGSAVAHVKLGRRYVTPLSDPRDDLGHRLVPAGPVVTPVGVDPHPGVADHARPDVPEV